MLIKIGKTQWIKAKKINAVQLCKKNRRNVGNSRVCRRMYI